MASAALYVPLLVLRSGKAAIAITFCCLLVGPGPLSLQVPLQQFLLAKLMNIQFQTHTLPSLGSLQTTVVFP